LFLETYKCCFRTAALMQFTAGLLRLFDEISAVQIVHNKDAIFKLAGLPDGRQMRTLVSS